ncbi:MAG: squalene/phytoene synthase family protein [Planctomycetes bacterium]|nr:squalene/phytoene synthase family protein [Planctomycetota bacterium]
MNAPAGATLTPQQVTERSGSNFLVGFLCLDRARRDGMTAIYAFCRVVDDAGDDARTPEEGRQAVAFWRGELAAAVQGSAATAVGQALTATLARFAVAPRHLEAVLDGVAMDLAGGGFADLPALEQYCWRVASAVGLACLPVLGVDGAAGERFAERLGLALQLTNILRDLRSDAEIGRVYVPRDWLTADGVEVAWLGGNGPDAAYRAEGPVHRLCERLAATAAERFAEAAAALRQLPRVERRRLAPARIMGAVYSDLLQRLRRRGGELRGSRVRVPKARRLWLAGLVATGLRA